MSASHRRILALIGALSICAACTGPTEPVKPALIAPALLTPVPGVPIRQNDATTGCPFSVTHGYGFVVDFTWSTVPGAAAYHLVLQHVGSIYAAIDTIVTGTARQVKECNSYVIDVNLHDWHWTVAARSADGQDGPWAGEGMYEFAPMVFPPQP